MANNLTYEQVYAVLNEVAKQATGAETLFQPTRPLRDATANLTRKASSDLRK